MERHQRHAGAFLRFERRLEGRRRQQRHVAIRDDHGAGEIFKRGRRTSRRMAGAELAILHHRLGAHLGRQSARFLCIAGRHHDDALHAGAAHRQNHMAQHG